MKLLAIAALLAAGAHAQQSPNVDQESTSRERRGALEEQAARNAATAQSATVQTDVTFDQILKAPGDIALNERYAREQIRRGDLRGAAGTLERVLMLAPERDSTRLVYAVVLYRLNDLSDADRELRLLQTRPLTAAEKSDAERYAKLVAQAQRHTHFDARLSLGFGYDDNRNASPDLGERLFFGVPLALDAGSLRQQDTNVQSAGELGVTQEIGGADAHSLFARVGYYRGDQNVVRILDLEAYTAQIGGVYHTLWADFVPSLGFEHVLLAQSTYLRDFTQDLRIARRISRRATAWLDVSHEGQDFRSTAEIPLGSDRKGDEYDLTLNGQYVLTPLDRVTATFGQRRKLAQNHADAYRRESADLEYMRMLGYGMYVSVGGELDFDRYDASDPTINSVDRHDNIVVGRLLFGAPLSLLWKPLDGFTGTLGYERFQDGSNIENYQYSNDKLTALITYLWGN